MPSQLLRIEDADFRAYPVFQNAGGVVGNKGAGILGSIFTTIIAPGSTVTLYDGLNATGKLMWEGDDSEVSASQINVRFSNGLFIVLTGAPSAAFSLIAAFA